MTVPDPGWPPSTRHRAVGDSGLIVEYGPADEDIPDLVTTFLIQVVSDGVRALAPPGLIDTAPALRSLLVTFDPDRLPMRRVIDLVNRVHADFPTPADLRPRGRLVHLPIAFDDEHSRRAVARYLLHTRSDAPNCEGGNNIDYLVRYNGLADRRELYRLILDTDWWTAALGHYGAMPYLIPMDQRTALSAPRYSPVRDRTAEGTVGMGGPCLVIYPMPTPGGHQLIGRTLRIFDPNALTNATSARPAVCPGDRVRFEEVDEREIDELRRAMVENRFHLWTDEQEFSVADHLARHRRRESEIAGVLRQRAAGARSTTVP